MKSLNFASRNTKEILRDPMTIIFSLGFPLVLLVLLSAINQSIPQDMPDRMTLFEIDSLAPALSVFGLSFLSLFSSLLIAKDRTTGFMLRLFTSPLSSADFILGYTIPLLPIAIAQTVACYAGGLCFGLELSPNIITAVFVNIPISLVFIAFGLLFGTLLNEKAVGGVCGALLTNLSAWFSNIWFDTSAVGGWFEAVANLLPFSHAVKAARYACAGEISDAAGELGIVSLYAAVLLTVSIIVFARKIKSDNK